MIRKKHEITFIKINEFFWQRTQLYCRPTGNGKNDHVKGISSSQTGVSAWNRFTWAEILTVLMRTKQVGGGAERESFDYILFQLPYAICVVFCDGDLSFMSLLEINPLECSRQYAAVSALT